MSASQYKWEHVHYLAPLYSRQVFIKVVCQAIILVQDDWIVPAHACKHVCICKKAQTNAHTFKIQMNPKYEKH